MTPVTLKGTNGTNPPHRPLSGLGATTVSSRSDAGAPGTIRTYDPQIRSQTNPDAHSANTAVTTSVAPPALVVGSAETGFRHERRHTFATGVEVPR